MHGVKKGSTDEAGKHKPIVGLVDGCGAGTYREDVAVADLRAVHQVHGVAREGALGRQHAVNTLVCTWGHQ